ncbi:MAG: TIM barrel protein [Bifidobacteriaceae bacterium]|jgi:hydroxypyruvate isomerase|nr:TIM barrel protein [Bifidobacteriaceae bacterium]
MTEPRYTVNCSILLKDRPLPERFAAVHAAGLDAVELWWPFATPNPPREEIDALVAALQANQVQLTGLNFDAGDMGAGWRGLVSVPSRAADFQANLDAVTLIGELTGCRAFNALYGNRQEGVDPAAQDYLGAQHLADAARAVGRIGGTVLLEPVSGAPAYPLLTVADVLGVMDRVAAEHGVTNIGLLLDVYHLSVNGDDVPAGIETARQRIAHVQIADSPGRGAPGTGELPLGAWIDNLQAGGYPGWIGLEYVADGDPNPFAWLAKGF